MVAVTKYATGADPTKGNTTWSNPGNVGADDGTYASFNCPRRSNSGEYWLIPAFTEVGSGDTVNSVLVEVQWKEASSVGMARTFQLLTGTFLKPPDLAGARDITTDTTESFSPVCTAADVRGENGYLNVFTTFNPDDDPVLVTIDFVRVTVDYTPTVTSVNGDGAAVAPPAQADGAGTVSNPSGGEFVASIQASGDDAHSAKVDHSGFDTGDGAGSSTFQMTLGCNYNNGEKLTVVGLRFQNVTIPAGATITAATLTVRHDYAQTGSFSDVFTDIHCENVGTAAAFSDTAGNRPSERPRTTTSSTWDITEDWTGSTGSHVSPDFSGAVQEVIDRADWSSGGNLAVLIVSADDSPAFSPRDFVSFDSGGQANAAELTITYQESTSVSGAGALTAPATTVAGSGDVVVGGSGAVVVGAATAGGSGAVAVSGAGATAVAASQASGLGSVAVGGDGSPLAPAAAATGSGTTPSTGTGVATTAAAVLAGTGTAVLEGDGALSAPSGQIVGSGATIVAGTGGAVSPGQVASGAGDLPVAGSGVLDPAAAIVSGTGSLDEPVIAGSGASAAPAAQTIGAGSVTVVGSGQAITAVASVAGSGNLDTPAVSGAGDALGPAATSGGAGSVEVTGDGQAAAATAAVVGDGQVVVDGAVTTGSGQATVTAARAAGSGTVPVDGNGSIVTPTAIITGFGAVVITGVGQASPVAGVVSGFESGPPVIVWPPRATAVHVEPVATASGVVALARVAEARLVSVEKVATVGQITSEPAVTAATVTVERVATAATVTVT